MRIPPIRRQGVLTPTLISSRVAHDGARKLHVYDAGRNMAGVCRFRLTGPAGSVARARYGEELYPDGSLNAMTSVAGQIKGPNKGAPCYYFVHYYFVH